MSPLLWIIIVVVITITIIIITIIIVIYLVHWHHTKYSEADPVPRCPRRDASTVDNPQAKSAMIVTST